MWPESKSPITILSKELLLEILSNVVENHLTDDK